MSKVIDLILLTSIYTACCAIGLCMATEQLVTGATPVLFNHLHLLIFGSTLLVYNLHHAAKKQLSPLYAVFPQRLYWCMSLLGALMAAYGLYWLSWKMLVGCACLGLFAFAYSFPLLPLKNKKKLREYGWLKIADLAIVWTVVTAILPIIYWDKSIADFPFEILLRFTFIFTLCLIFDMRDIQVDVANNISTLPAKLGLRNSYRLINISLLLFALLSVVQYVRYPVLYRLLGAILTALVTWSVVNYLKAKRSSRVYMLLADGVMLLYAVMLLVVASL